MPPPGWEERSWAPTATAGGGPGGGGPPLDSLSRRVQQAAGVLSVLLMGVLANSVLNSGRESLNPIAEAAKRTQRMPGARMDVVAIYTSSASSNRVVASGSGAYNARTGRSRVVLAVPNGIDKTRIASVGDDRMIFMRSAEISAQLPPGRPWMAFQPLLGGSSKALAIGDSSVEGGLEMLSAAGDVESLGEEAVRGVKTERYGANIQLGRFAEVLRQQGKGELARLYRHLAGRMAPPIQVEVWVDDGRLVRRLRQVTSAAAGGGQPTVTTDMRIDFHGFRASPKIEMPSAARAIDLTPLARVELQMLSPATVRAPIDPPPGQSLTAKAFRAKGNAICGALTARGEALARRAKASPELRRLEESAERGFGDERVRGLLQSYSVRYFEPAIDLVEKSLRRLGRLRPPVESRPEFERLMRAGAYTAELQAANARALEIGAVATARGISKVMDRKQHLGDGIARRLGLRACIGSYEADGGGSAAGSVAA